jgi:heterodisulfide reductase subunit B
MGLNIITLCNGCTENLTKANKALKESPELRAEVNEILRERNHSDNSPLN